MFAKYALVGSERTYYADTRGIETQISKPGSERWLGQVLELNATKLTQHVPNMKPTRSTNAVVGSAVHVYGQEL